MPKNSKRLRYALPAAALATALICATALAAAPPVAAPTATTGGATSITYESAAVASTVNPGNQATEVYFQYGLTAAYGTETTASELPAGTKSVSVTATLSGLVADTAYDYRIVAINASGRTNGAERTLKTSKIPASLAIVADPNPVSFDGPVAIEGTLAGSDNANQPVALQQSVYPYTAGFVQVGNSELTRATGAFAFNVLSASANSQYRVVSVKNPNVQSPVVNEPVAIVATLKSHGIGTSSHPESRFSGTASPGLETGARIAIEQLTGGAIWKVVGGTITASFTHNGVATFKLNVRYHHGGFFRVLVESVEGAHISGYSPTLIARGY
jgi:hypothetical protein